MDFDTNTIAAGFVAGMVGTALIIYGKKQERLPHILCGVIFVIYPYFIPNVLITAAIGVVLLSTLFGVTRYLGA